jgi:hypothetical protein
MDESRTSDSRDERHARETVRRFVARGQLSSMESLKGGSGPATESQLRLTAERAWVAGAQDPLALEALRGSSTPQELAAHLTEAMALMTRDGEAAVLSPAQIGSLEAISLLVDRPALQVRSGRFEPPLGAWSRLAANVQDLVPMLASVGRLSVAPAYGGALGTAFVVGDGLIMTNRHVLDYLYTPDGNGGQLIDGLSMTIDFKQEYGSTASSVFEVTGLRRVFSESSGIDLALLEVKGQGRAGERLPNPLLLQSRPAVVKSGTAVCVVGYPQADPARNNAGEMDRIFEQVYDVKRLSPGFVTAGEAQGSFSHDCTTLGGNSGSCVIDLETASVIGLHWGGDYLSPNHALSLPSLAKTLTGLNFGSA